MHAPLPRELVWRAKPIEALIPIMRGSEVEKEDDVENEDEGDVVLVEGNKRF